MEMEMPSDFDRVLLFEQARRTAEANYASNPLDAENLTRWGGVLLELSQFQSGGPESKKMLQDAIDKLEEALVVDPAKHDAFWYLGNAYTSNAFLIPDHEEAKDDFEKAAQYYEQAYELDPQNDLYRKSVEVAGKAPEIHMEIHKQGGFGQQAASTSSSSRQQSSKKNGSRSSDFKYDVFGWVILAVGIFVWVGFAKNSLPPPPTPR